VLCDDLSLNRELIDTNVKEDLSNYEIVELKKLSQSRLNEKVSAHIIDTILNCCQSMFAHYMYFLPLYNLVMLFEEGTSQNILDDTLFYLPSYYM
jgi:hypothetical protein